MKNDQVGSGFYGDFIVGNAGAGMSLRLGHGLAGVGNGFALFDHAGMMGRCYAILL